MMNTNIVYFLGPTGSGKTSSLENITKQLYQQKNISIGTIKFIHHSLSIDPVGKDSSRHRKAGALYTINFAPQETAIILSKEQRETIEDGQRMINESSGILPEVDIIFCESLNNPPAKSNVFISANTTEDVDQYIEQLNECNILAIIGTIANKKEGKKKINEYRSIPILSAMDQRDLEILVQKIEKILDNKN